MAEKPHAPTDIDYLLAENEKLREEVTELKRTLESEAWTNERIAAVARRAALLEGAAIGERMAHEGTGSPSVKWANGYRAGCAAYSSKLRALAEGEGR